MTDYWLKPQSPGPYRTSFNGWHPVSLIVFFGARRGSVFLWSKGLDHGDQSVNLKFLRDIRLGGSLPCLCKKLTRVLWLWNTLILFACHFLPGGHLCQALVPNLTHQESWPWIPKFKRKEFRRVFWIWQELRCVPEAEHQALFFKRRMGADFFLHLGLWTRQAIWYNEL